MWETVLRELEVILDLLLAVKILTTEDIVRTRKGITIILTEGSKENR